MDRECSRYGLDPQHVAATLRGEDPLAQEKPHRHWWELLVVAVAVAVFLWLGSNAERPAIAMHGGWTAILSGATLVALPGLRLPALETNAVLVKPYDASSSRTGRCSSYDFCTGRHHDDGDPPVDAGH